MLDNNSTPTGSGTGRRRSTFYVALAENSSENKDTPDKNNTSINKISPSKKMSNSNQALTNVEPRRSSTSKSPAHTCTKSPAKTPTRMVAKSSSLHAPQPLRACTRTIQGPQLLKVGPPQSPRTPKKSSSLLQLSSTKSPSLNTDSPQKTGKPLQLSLSLRRTPSTKPTVVIASKSIPKSTAAQTLEQNKIPVVVVNQPDGDQDVRTPRVNKEVLEDEPGEHSGK